MLACVADGWEQGLVTANGRMGVALWGPPGEEVLTVSLRGSSSPWTKRSRRCPPTGITPSLRHGLCGRVIARVPLTTWWPWHASGAWVKSTGQIPVSPLSRWSSQEHARAAFGPMHKAVLHVGGRVVGREGEAGEVVLFEPESRGRRRRRSPGRGRC